MPKHKKDKPSPRKVTMPTDKPQKTTRADTRKDAKPRPFPIVGISASAGGLEAFSELLRALPEKGSMAFVLVQHLDPSHGSAPQEILSRTTKIPVTQVTDGVTVEPDHVYVIPANTSMSIKDGVLRLAARVHETTLEEYKSANEEVLSANDELQSTNEELETAKEELQSTNEELTTLNEELQNRNTELTLANNDLHNLFANANIPVVIVGNDLRIRRFTPPAQKLLNLLPGDIGRRLGEIRPNLEKDDLEQLAQETIESTIMQEREVRELQNGAWHILRVRPYKTWDNKIDGAVISFQDIDALKRNLEQGRTYSDFLIENAREPTLVLDSSLRVTVANPAFYRTFKVSPAETEGNFVYDLGKGEWNILTLRNLLQTVARGDARLDDFELRQAFPDMGPRVMLVNARPMHTATGRVMIFLSIEDKSEQTERLESLKRQAALLDLAHDAIFTRNFEGTIQYWNHGAEELYGWEKEEAIGKSVYDLLRTEYPKPIETILDEIAGARRWKGELIHTCRDGSRKTVSSRWALTEPGNSEPIVLEINTDVTRRKTSEDALRILSGRLMQVQDDERRRIARELHDSTGQKLAALRINLDMVVGKKGGGKDGRPLLKESINLVEELTREIRTLAQVLHPPLLEEAGLHSAIQWLVNGFSSRAGIKVDLAIRPDSKRLSGEIELALFRVIQESLTNIHRHSGASEARIEMDQTPQAVILTISDNGKGVPEDVLATLTDAKQPLGVGLFGMRERLAQFGGKLEIRSGSKGTVVKAEVPTYSPPSS